MHTARRRAHLSHRAQRARHLRRRAWMCGRVQVSTKVDMRLNLNTATWIPTEIRDQIRTAVRGMARCRP
eukprot:363939-Chlamydomonas_euryale.AAC.6